MFGFISLGVPSFRNPPSPLSFQVYTILVDFVSDFFKNISFLFPYILHTICKEDWFSSFPDDSSKKKHGYSPLVTRSFTVDTSS